MMRILVLGATGNVGAAIVEAALGAGHDVGAVSRSGKGLGLATADHHGESYRLSGPSALTAADRAEILGAALGRELTVVVPSDEEAREGLPPEYADAFHEFYRGGLIDETTVHPTVERLLGRPPGTFAAWAAANRDQFTR
jgi:uncharacterized protein YbjT (DUF2867 family)